jgi:hypothetical protein
MVIVKLEGLVKRRGWWNAGGSFTTEDLTPEVELAEIFRKLGLAGDIATGEHLVGSLLYWRNVETKDE